MKKNYVVVDLFCGAGGESTGILKAAEEQGLNVSLTAINHWERAIETHAANHPSAEHWCQSIEQLDPTVVIKNGKVNLLWASPECTHHSNARGGKPRSDQSRASAWLILKWLSELYVERVIIENVPEFLIWGPLDNLGYPIQKRKGEVFNAFINALRSFGYIVDWRILTAADYGDPTTRRRLFIQAVKGSKKILWPEITHTNDNIKLPHCQPWRSAKEIIDWTIPGTSIFDRKKPLADATLRRIAVGIEKYWGEYAKPFIAVLHGTSTVKSIDEPLSTVACSGAHHALIEPVPLLMGHESGQMPKPVDDPCQTVLAQGRINLIQPFISRFHGGEGSEKRNHSINDPLPTLDTSNRYGIVQPLVMEYYGNGKTDPVTKPLGTVTTKDRFALLELAMKGVKLDILFRMLKNPELKRAQGFPRNYDIKGNTTEQTKQIGNAVPVNTAKALARMAMI